VQDSGYGFASPYCQQNSRHMGIFDEVISIEDMNLTSKNKRKVLNRRFDLKGYEYVGNSQADISIWKTAFVSDVVKQYRGMLAVARCRAGGVTFLKAAWHMTAPY
jgi:hypothetical protein